MPVGTYTMLKPTNGTPFFEEYKSGAHYYVFAPNSSVSRYKKASAIIILPRAVDENLKLKGTGRGRNAYISFGIECGSDRGIDIGIVNKGLDGGGDDGFGWEPYCNENKLGIPHKFAGNRAPSGAKRARIEVEPATNGGTIQFSVIWLDGNNREISGANHLRNCTIDLGKNYNMNNFFPFASLVPWPETTSTYDGTYMLGGGFDSVKLGSYNSIQLKSDRGLSLVIFSEKRRLFKMEGIQRLMVDRFFLLQVSTSISLLTRLQIHGNMVDALLKEQLRICTRIIVVMYIPF